MSIYAGAYSQLAAILAMSGVLYADINGEEKKGKAL
jgi:hypothetical protein